MAFDACRPRTYTQTNMPSLSYSHYPSAAYAQKPISSSPAHNTTILGLKDRIIRFLILLITSILPNRWNLAQDTLAKSFQDRNDPQMTLKTYSPRELLQLKQAPAGGQLHTQLRESLGQDKALGKNSLVASRLAIAALANRPRWLQEKFFGCLLTPRLAPRQRNRPSSPTKWTQWEIRLLAVKGWARGWTAPRKSSNPRRSHHAMELQKMNMPWTMPAALRRQHPQASFAKAILPWRRPFTAPAPATCHAETPARLVC